MDFRLPDLGEGIDSATVVEIRVKPGDRVSKDQEVLSVETDKAAMPVSVDQNGTIEQIHIKPGDKISAGTLLLTLSGGGGTAPSAPASAHVTPPAVAVKPEPTPVPQSAGGQKVEFRLPVLGEGIDSGTVVAVRIQPGDTVKKDQEVLEIETDKAAMPVPIDVAGTVEEVRIRSGDKISIGAVIAIITTSGSSSQTATPVPVAPTTSPKTPVAPPAPTVATPAVNGSAAHGPVSVAATGVLVPAGPATRRLARELGVALTEIKGSARGGRVTVDDVKGYVKNRLIGATPAPVGKVTGSIVDAFALPPLPDFSKFGTIEKKPVAKIRETIARNLTVAWRTMPMVTQHDLADITDLEAGRKRIVDALPKGAPKITMTVLAVKAVVAALKEFPTFNSSYDMNAGELVLKKYYHIGIAVDTERGLVVPVIRDADKKSIRDIATEVVGIAEKARTGKLTLEEMRGGSFTITNLGGIGGTAFTPIVNYPEVAILGLSRSSLQPVVRDGQIVPRLMMPMSLTYDHRVVDGADGARFTSRLTQLFSDPIRLLMES
ncbi:MAG: 2-oxo acid dehydrogenase subunit E2 [Bacteroidales bacterium]|nr:2-oxo acid dehydrogenase subunit E2 [Bacteroidales bacterium]